jgi:hypothetical protein
MTGDATYRVDRTIVSPDGKLTFVVWSHNGDIGMSFENYPWHTHPGLWPQIFEGGTDAAVEGVIADLVTGVLVIAIGPADGVIKDVWIASDMQRELENCPSDERIEFRLWDGTRLTPRLDD